MRLSASPISHQVPPCFLCRERCFTPCEFLCLCEQRLPLSPSQILAFKQRVGRKRKRHPASIFLVFPINKQAAAIPRFLCHLESSHRTDPTSSERTEQHPPQAGAQIATDTETRKREIAMKWRADFHTAAWGQNCSNARDKQHVEMSL